jgi:hypothetical protein
VADFDSNSTIEDSLVSAMDAQDSGVTPEPTATQEPYTAPAQQESAPAPVESAPAKGNPAWEPLRTKLAPEAFSQIEPDLLEMDRLVQQRLTTLSQQQSALKGFERLAGQASPEQIEQQLQALAWMNANPKQLHEQLTAYLQQAGELEASGEPAPVGPDGQPEQFDITQHPRFQELAQQQAQLTQFFQQQQVAEQERQADSALETEIGQLKSAHPDLTDADVQEVMGRAYMRASQSGKAPSLEEAFADYDALRTRFMTTPRPGDSAPRLVPTSGGNPPAAPGQQRTVGQLSNREVEDVLADVLGRTLG